MCLNSSLKEWSQDLHDIFMYMQTKTLSLQKAEKQMKLAKKNSPTELANMKKAYDAASAFTTIMSNTIDKSIPYNDFEEMNQDMLR
jgi:hypothetical protein